MSETVVVGEQTFIKTDKGWIDKQSKAPAPSALLEIIELFPREEDIKLSNIRQKIGRKPIELGGDKYIFDAKKNLWLNNKTKKPADNFIQQIIADTYDKVEKGKSQISTNDISKSYGIAGTAKVKQKKAEQAAATAGQIKLNPQTLAINTTIVKMIGVLASIDSFLSKRLENQKIISRNTQIANREAQIEGKDQEQPQTELKKVDAEKVSGSGLGMLALGGLALLALDPVRQGLEDIATGVVSVAKFIGRIISPINSMLEFFTGKTTKKDINKEIEKSLTADSAAAGNTSAVPNIPPPPQPDAVAETPLPTTQTNQSTLSGSVAGGMVAGAATGAAIGSIVPGVGTAVGAGLGAVAGGLIGNASYFSTPSATAQSKEAATPAATPKGKAKTATPPATPTKPPAAETENKAITSVGLQVGKSFRDKMQANAKFNATNTNAKAREAAREKEKEPPAGIPLAGDSIVPLGKYLQGLGYKVSEHPEFGGVGQHSENSRHYRGMALDLNIVPGDDSKDPRAAGIFDKLKPLLEKAGYNVLWRTKGHFDHMHVSIGGPEGAGGGDYDSSLMMDSFKSIASMAGKFSGIFIQPGVLRDDIPGMINTTAVQTNAAIAKSKDMPLPKSTTVTVAPNINRTGEGPVQAPATSVDTQSVTYYLRRFAMQDISTPIIALKPAMSK